MSLLEEAATEARRPGGKCSLGPLLAMEGFGPELQALLESGHSNNTVSAVLKKHGYEIGPASVGRHRRHLCQCPTS